MYASLKETTLVSTFSFSLQEQKPRVENPPPRWRKTETVPDPMVFTTGRGPKGRGGCFDVKSFCCNTARFYSKRFPTSHPQTRSPKLDGVSEPQHRCHRADEGLVGGSRETHVPQLMCQLHPSRGGTLEAVFPWRNGGSQSNRGSFPWGNWADQLRVWV